MIVTSTHHTFVQSSLPVTASCLQKPTERSCTSFLATLVLDTVLLSVRIETVVRSCHASLREEACEVERRGYPPV